MQTNAPDHTRPLARSWKIGFACAVLLMTVGGCIPYPALKTVKKARDFQIVDGSGAAIAGATVVYTSAFNPHHRVESREIGVSGSDGRLSFASDYEVQLQTLMIHGSKSYYWYWCVAAPGFETYRSPGQSSEKGKTVVVTLRSGDSKPCPTGDEPVSPSRTRPQMSHSPT